MQNLIVFLGSFPCAILSSVATSIYYAPEHLAYDEGTLTMFLLVILWFSLLLPNVDAASAWKRIISVYCGCAILGAAFGVAIRIDSMFSVYITLFCYFHFSEFVLITVSHGVPKFDSLMLNHSINYASAFTLSAAEHFYSPVHFPLWVELIGLVAALIGLAIRGSALFTAGSAFTHLISTKRVGSHELVTKGIYSVMRHPGYCGWLIWVVSSQVVAGNPISTIVFAVTTWFFFRSRIGYEEELLVEMFGSEYQQYRHRVSFSGVPFIR